MLSVRTCLSWAALEPSLGLAMEMGAARSRTRDRAQQLCPGLQLAQLPKAAEARKLIQNSGRTQTSTASTCTRSTQKTAHLVGRSAQRREKGSGSSEGGSGGGQETCCEEGVGAGAGPEGAG